jgi:hypothetical protein
MATTDREYAAIKLMFPDPDTAAIVNNIISTGTHNANLTAKHIAYIRDAFDSGGQKALDFLTALTAGSTTIGDKTINKLKLLTAGNFDVVATLTTKVNAIT